MIDALSHPEKPLGWIASSYKDLMALPGDIRRGWRAGDH